MLKITEVVLVHCNIVNCNIVNIVILLTMIINAVQNKNFLKTFDSEFSYIKVWFTDQNSELLETEDKRNITLVKVSHILNCLR